jgi:putative transposase
MPRFARAIAVGFPHHVTQRGTDRECVFFTKSDREVYLDLLRSSARQASLRILAYCLMPNHIHLVAVPDEPDSLSVALRRAHGRYANYLNARRGRTGHLWQNRFYSCALDRDHLSVALRYVERNPVRAGLAERVEQYLWSSAPAHLTGRDPRNLLEMSFWQERGGAKDWRSLLATPEELLAVRLLQRATFTGRPVGSAGFVDQLEAQLERTLRPHQGVRARPAAG